MMTPRSRTPPGGLARDGCIVTGLLKCKRAADGGETALECTATILTTGRSMLQWLVALDLYKRIPHSFALKPCCLTFSRSSVAAYTCSPKSWLVTNPPGLLSFPLVDKRLNPSQSRFLDQRIVGLHCCQPLRIDRWNPEKHPLASRPFKKFSASHLKTSNASIFRLGETTK